jgi:ABC-type transport system involved in multi-copper enzyme maturation permease subunit
MFNLLRAQLYRLFHGKLYFVILLINIFINIFGVAAYWMLENDPSTGREGVQSVKGYNLMCMVIRSGGIEVFEIMAIAFVALFIASGFRQGNIKSEISFGYNRVSIYLSKLFLSMVGVAGIAASGMLTGLAAGSAFFGFGSPVGGDVIIGLIRAFLLVILVSPGLCSIYVLISFVFKEPGAIIGVYSVFTVLITNLLVAQLSMRFEWFRKVTEYIPQTQLYNVASIDFNPATAWTAVAYTVVLILASTLAGCAVFRKQDIA